MTPNPEILEAIRRAVESAHLRAVASHCAAAYVWGFGPVPERIDLLVRGSGRPRPRPGVIIHRTAALTDDEISTRHGIRVTNPLRTLLDLGAVAPGDVAGALVETAVSRLVTPSAARAALDRASVRGRHGLGALRAALDAWPEGVETPDSSLEVEIGRLLDRSSITGFVHHELVDGFEVDFAHARRRLVLEGDGFEFHSSRATFESDRLRDATLAATGWVVVRVTWWQVTTDSDGVVDRLRRALSSRGYARSRASLLPATHDCGVGGQ